MKTNKLILFLSVLSVMVCCSSPKPIDTVTVDGGQLRGILTDNPSVMVFKGVPYAAAPVGDLRWALPREVTPWEGVRVADTFGSPAVQLGRQEGSFYYKEFQPEPLPPVSEDCLFLNIWTPSDAVGHADRKLPVAMWIHGGAFYGGCGNDVAFDGEAWASRGVILVTINYRLGIMGFMSHPELSAENPYGASGNQGIYDQLQAIKWIKANISQFGGDPDNLTVMGQSAGAMSVKILAASPLAKGLINKAIIQSGGGVSKSLAGGIPDRTPADYDAASKAAWDALGLDDLGKMRAASADQLINIRTVPGGTHVDGNLITESFDEAAYANRILDIPYMIGSNGDDMTPEILKEGCARFGAVRDSLGTQPTYVYFFDRKLPGDDSGSFHSAELWYMFHTLGRSWRPMEEHDFALSDKMMDYWTNFAKFGNPNGKDVDGQWKPYTRTSPYVEQLK